MPYPPRQTRGSAGPQPRPPRHHQFLLCEKVRLQPAVCGGGQTPMARISENNPRIRQIQRCAAAAWRWPAPETTRILWSTAVQLVAVSFLWDGTALIRFRLPFCAPHDGLLVFWRNWCQNGHPKGSPLGPPFFCTFFDQGGKFWSQGILQQVYAIRKEAMVAIHQIKNQKKKSKLEEVKRGKGIPY